MPCLSRHYGARREEQVVLTVTRYGSTELLRSVSPGNWPVRSVAA
jgi:hypothetical protein